MTATATPQLRWSSVRDCPRKAILEATHEPDRDWTRLERGYLWRGRRIGQDFVLFNAYEHGWLIHVASGPNDWVPQDVRAADQETAGLVAEVPIKWPLGTGHADLLIRETMTLVEVLSSAHGDSLIDGKLLQLVGYLAHYPEAENGALVVVDPSSMIETDRIIVSRDSRLYRDLEAEVHERIARVQAGLAGSLPARVCKKPGDARAHFCRFAATCFEGWEPEPVNVNESPEFRRLAVERYEAQQDRKALQAQLAPIETRLKAIDAAMREFVEPSATVETGPLKVTRRYTAPYEQAGKKALTAMRASGFWTDALDELVPLVGGKDYCIVDRTSDAPLIDADDFGDHPFDEPLGEVA